MNDVTGYLSESSLAQLRALIGRTIDAFGFELEVDDLTGAFSVWLQLGDETITLEFAEEILDFPGFESVEPVLHVDAPTGDNPGGDPHEVGSEITAITRIQDNLTQFARPSNDVEWSWWRDAGLRFSLADGRDLVLHCADTRSPEVKVRLGVNPLITVPRRDIYQSGEKRRFESDRREVSL